MKYKKTLFVFRRDLRLEDNTGLLFALKNSEEVLPCFIFTPEQIQRNPYRSERCLQFMIESLEDLEGQLKKKGGRLSLFYDSPERVVERCIQKLSINAVVVNRDYTPYSIRRDQKLAQLCKKRQIAFHSFDDALLQPPELTLKPNSTPYTLFTPFFRRASTIKVPLPSSNRYNSYSPHLIPFAHDASLYQKILPRRKQQAKGGRGQALKILKDLNRFSKYKSIRDFPSLEGTTLLSAHLKFTTCSIREAYHAFLEQLGKRSDLIRSLYWRDFFTCVAFHFPKVFTGAFRPPFDRIQWSYSRAAFKKWCEGKTGFPIVDAGMREMNQTGFMHNRVRMIVASFLVKDLLIDWRWGEKYFAQHLIDYDPSLNNGNWQWVAGTGADAQPYFRIFNPWAQQKKFDPECVYIKKWIPELAKVPPKQIHEWHSAPSPLPYPPPMLDHDSQAKKALAAYRKSL